MSQRSGPPDFRTFTLRDLAEWVSVELNKHEVTAILVGGACVTLYSENRYQSYDLDFVSYTRIKALAQILGPFGFELTGRCFKHPDSPYLLDFIHPPIAVGNEPIRHFEQIGAIQLLTPTDCVKDRLAAYYHWNDPQGLEQAVLVAQAHEVDLANIAAWSTAEGFQDQYLRFSKDLGN